MVCLFVCAAIAACSSCNCDCDGQQPVANNVHQIRGRLLLLFDTLRSSLFAAEDAHLVKKEEEATLPVNANCQTVLFMDFFGFANFSNDHFTTVQKGSINQST